MTNESANSGRPPAVDRTTFQAELDKLRAREKARTREGDAIAATRRRLPMVEVEAGGVLVGFGVALGSGTVYLCYRPV